jgi:hypothetical protein
MLQVYRVSDGTLLWEVPRQRSSSKQFTFSRDGTRIFLGVGEVDAAGSNVVHLKAWEATTGAPIYDVVPEKGPRLTLDLTADGAYLIGSVEIGEGWGFGFWRAEDGTLARTFPQTVGFWNSNLLAVSPAGGLFATNTMRGGPRGSEAARASTTGPSAVVQVWNMDGTLLYHFDKELFSLSFSPDGQTFATTDLDGAISVYRTSDGQRIARKEFSESIF